MSERSSTTLGYEWSTNPYLDRSLDRETFVQRILSDLPPRPPYYARMKELNSRGAPSLGGLPGDRELDLPEFESVMAEDAVIIDLRDQLAFGGGHIPGSFGIGGNGNVSGWASWVVPYDRPILLLTASEEERRRVIRSLIRVGLDDIRGSLAGGIATWREAGRPLGRFEERTPEEVARGLAEGSLLAVDVRRQAEWDEGHIEGARWHYLGHLAEQWESSGDDRDVVLVCRTGYRSTVAASVLERAGVKRLVNLTGGMRAWKNAGLPVS